MSLETMVNTAVSLLGTTEGGESHRVIIDTYNHISPLPRGYHMTMTDAWCAAFVTAVSRISGNADAIPAECGCPEMVRLFVKRGIAVGRRYPKRGDIIFYDWNGDQIADHVGIVQSVSDKGKVTTIEGNYFDRVKSRVIDYNDYNIYGYATPNYSTGKKADKLLDWERDAVTWAKAHNISDGQRPRQAATRAEVMLMLKNFEKEFKK